MQPTTPTKKVIDVQQEGHWLLLRVVYVQLTAFAPLVSYSAKQDPRSQAKMIFSIVYVKCKSVLHQVSKRAAKFGMTRLCRVG